MIHFELFSTLDNDDDPVFVRLNLIESVLAYKGGSEFSLIALSSGDCYIVKFPFKRLQELLIEAAESA